VSRRLWDDELARLDQALHGRFSPSRLFVGLFEGTLFLSFIDLGYKLWLPVSLAMFAPGGTVLRADIRDSLALSTSACRVPFDGILLRWVEG